MKNLTTAELEKLSHHNLNLATVMNYANPFNGCWMELEKPITKEEVAECIKNGHQELVVTPIWTEVAFNPSKWPKELVRENHIKKIAYFATNDIETPIQIDVGIPSMGAYVDYIVDDGNHRLAGAIYKGDLTIKAKISGDINYAQEQGLWSPNEFEEILHVRYEEEMIARQKKDNSKKFKI